MNAAVADAKEIFGENLPYITEYRMDGKVYIFNDHFIRVSREAMTNDCMAKMNEAETELFLAFIDYQNGLGYRDITSDDTDVVEALDQWYVDDINCVPHPVMNSCYDTETHTWAGCGTVDDRW